MRAPIIEKAGDFWRIHHPGGEAIWTPWLLTREDGNLVFDALAGALDRPVVTPEAAAVLKMAIEWCLGKHLYGDFLEAVEAYAATLRKPTPIERLRALRDTFGSGSEHWLLSSIIAELEAQA